MIIERDVAIPASDGLILRADVFRPDDEVPAPAVLVLGPYGKGVEYKSGYATQWKWLLNKHPDLLPGSTRSYMAWETVDPEIWTQQWGYVCIRVDSRGTGRTPGQVDIFSPRETKDLYESIEWAGVQSWCSGKVGLCGISYYAMNQWRVAQHQPPHLTAMIPWEGAADHYRDYLRHGGIVSNAFFEYWYNKQVISNQHGNPRGFDDPWLQEKATGPETLSAEELEANNIYALPEVLKRPIYDQWYDERSVDWSKVITPFLSAANWGGTGLHGRGNYEGFTRAASTQKWLEIHPGRHDEAFYLNDAMALQKRFFDYFLKGMDNGWDQEPSVLMQKRRPEQPYSGIRKASSWPLPNTEWTKFYLSGATKTLNQSPAISPSTITFSAMKEELLFFSEPLTHELEITGPIALKLFLSSSTAEADLFITFQAFSPDGKEVEFQGGWDPHTPLGQGWLRASHRKLDTSLSLPHRPYHSHDEVQPLNPGEIYELDVEVWPTHIILPTGYHFALRIAGRDFQRPTALNKSFLLWMEKGAGPFLHNHHADRGSNMYAGNTTIHMGPESESYLLLPVIPSEE